MISTLIASIISRVILNRNWPALKAALHRRERILDVADRMKLEGAQLSAFYKDEGFWGERISGHAIDLQVQAARVYIDAVHLAVGPMFQNFGNPKECDTCFDKVYFGAWVRFSKGKPYAHHIGGGERRKP